MRISVIVIILLILFSTIITIIKVAGQTQIRDHMDQIAPIIAVVREFERVDDHWCWRGLCSGQTPFQEVLTRLPDTTMFDDIVVTSGESATWTWVKAPSLLAIASRAPDTDHLGSLAIVFHEHRVTVLDVMLLFGAPLTIDSDSIGSERILNICLLNNVCVTSIVPSGTLTPDAYIESMFFEVADNMQDNVRYVHYGWRGFMDYRTHK
ncbi:MAG: hypothetical protein KF716_08410 [Anaerolineae bacterium]|nr:hypothetical protein [Anaerolineae bacterium]